MTDKNAKLAITGTRLLDLRRKLKARDGKPEYAESNKALRAEISRLENTTARQAGEEPE